MLSDHLLKNELPLCHKCSDDAIRALYVRYAKDPLIKWKHSIKQVVGPARPAEAGLDV